MPRGKTNAPTSKTGLPKNPRKSEGNGKAQEVAEELTVESSPSGIVNDLCKFKYEKKPHVKIEFEIDSPVKEEPKGLWEPNNWEEFLLNLRNMRSNNDAPVDSMGCDKAMDENAPPEVMRYQSLIALMLSSQTKDQVTFAAMERLRAQGLTIDNVLAMSDEELGKLIYPVGFWKTKVKYIKKTTQTLKDQYKGDIPDSADKLCKLTGVGPKMAHICMKVAWNKITGIGVDTHVHRISNRIGWVKKPTATPEDTRKALQTWLPFDLWSEVNHLMVGFGQTICTPISPICNECLNRDICPSSGKGRKSPKKSPSKIVQEDIEGKPETSRKITPSKELKVIQDFEVKNENNTVKTELLDVKEVLEKVPRKRKVTPKKTDVNVDQQTNKQHSDLCKSQKSSHKKITPSKDFKVIQDFEVKNEMNTVETELLNVKEVPEKVPRKRKVTPKNMDVKVDQQTNKQDPDVYNFETKINMLLNKVELQLNTAPDEPIRKKNTPKKEDHVEHFSSQDIEDIHEVGEKTQKATNRKGNQNNLKIKSKGASSNTIKLVDKSQGTDQDISKKSPLKRKSPRNKKVDVALGDTKVPEKRTKSVKK